MYHVVAEIKILYTLIFGSTLIFIDIKLKSDLFCKCMYRMGGIIPPVARDLHKKNVEKIVNLALDRASMSAAVRFEIAVKFDHCLSVCK